MEITFASSESTSFLKDPTILIAAGALIISIITLYYTFFRKAKILSFKPKAIILKTNENQLLAEIRNVYLLNSTANKTTAIMDIWLVLSGRSSSIKIDFQKEKMIQVGIEKYPSVPSQALWSNSALIHLEPLIPRLSEMHFVQENITLPMIKDEYELSLYIKAIKSPKTKKLWSIKFRLPKDLNIKKQAIGYNLESLSGVAEFRIEG